jgi:peroxiredoxin
MESEVPAVGQAAPDFDLPAAIGEATGERVTLSQYRGQKHVVLAFYVLDWTST